MKLQEMDRLIEQVSLDGSVYHQRVDEVNMVLTNYTIIFQFFESIKSSDNFITGKISMDLLKKIYNLFKKELKAEASHKIEEFLNTIKSIITSKYYGELIFEDMITNNINNFYDLYNLEINVINMCLESIEKDFVTKKPIDLTGYRKKIFQACAPSSRESAFFSKKNFIASY